MTIPVFDLGRATPGQMTMPYVAGGAVEGGRSMSGVTSAVNTTGGGLVTFKYGNIKPGNGSDGPSKLRYINQIAAILNGGVRSIIVPMLVDFSQPANPALFINAPSLASGIVFNTPSSDSPDTIGATALNAGTVTLSLGSRSLTGGEWFEVVHPTKLNRVYQVTDIDTVTVAADGSQIATVGIVPPIREAIPGVTAVNWTQPKCVMRLAPGTTISVDVTGYWWTTAEITFIESMGPFV